MDNRRRREQFRARDRNQQRQPIMTSEKRKTILKRTVGILLAVYVGLYVVNSLFGGYDPHYNNDGWSRYRSEPWNKHGDELNHHCIMWQPRFGCYYNAHQHDLVGLAFYPLIRVDQHFIHVTHTVADEDFTDWWKSTTAVDIHPAFQQDFERMKQ